MSKETEDIIVNILSRVPKHILINCAKKIKKNNSLPLKQKIEPKKSTLKPKPKMSKNVMLAHVYDPDKHEKKVANWWMSIKYDGVRGKWNGEEMESRTGKIYTLPDFITEQLEKIVDDDGEPMQLDGEIWFGNDTQAIASGASRRFDNDPELWKQMTYMIFDMPDTDLIFEDRVKKVGAALKKAGTLPNVKGVKHRRFDPLTMNIQDELVKVEETGGEGLVLRKPNSLYVFNRSNDMLKVKSWSYKDCIVKGYVEGTGKYTGMVGSLAVESDEFGDEDKEGEEDSERKWVSFKVGSGLNDWQRFSGNVTGNWKSKETQTRINNLRTEKMLKQQDIDYDNYKKLIHIANTSSGKERSDALHRMNDIFTQMPVIGMKICFRFKELTKQGHPSMPTFVCCRDDYEHE